MDHQRRHLTSGCRLMRTSLQIPELKLSLQCDGVRGGAVGEDEVRGWGSRERGQCPYEREHSSLPPYPTLHVRLRSGDGCFESGSGRKGDFTPEGLRGEATHLGSGLPLASHSIWKYSSKGKATCSFDCFVMVGTCGTKWYKHWVRLTRYHSGALTCFRCWREEGLSKWKQQDEPGFLRVQQVSRKECNSVPLLRVAVYSILLEIKAKNP